MTQFLGKLDIVSGITDNFENVSLQGYKGIIIGNESGLSVVVSMEGQGDTKSLYPGTVDFFPIKQGFSGTITISNTALLNNVTSWPSSFIQFDAVGIGDSINTSVYPLTLPRLTNIGNPVNANVTNANALINTGNSNPQNIITVQPSDAASPTWLADSAGNLIIKSDVAGALKTLLQLISGANPQVLLSATGLLTEILGNLKVDGLIESTTNSGILFDVVATPIKWITALSSCQILGDNLADQIDIDAPTGTRVLIINANGIQIQGTRNIDIGSSGTFKMRNSAGTLTRLGDTSGTGTGTVNHNLGVSPDFMAITTHSVGSQTVGYDSETATQVHVTAAAGLAWFGFLLKR